MELHPLQIERPVTHAHDEPVRSRRHLKLGRQVLIEHDQRMVSADDQGIRNAAEDARVVVGDEARAAVQ